jgi:hypothetical protein
LRYIEIPARVTFIDFSALAGTPLISISVAPESKQFRLRDWFLESSDGSTIYRYYGGCHSVVVPSSIVVLGKRVSMAAHHLNLFYLKAVLDLSGLRNLHFLMVDCIRLSFHHPVS